jgi:hypothetical protein
MQYVCDPSARAETKSAYGGRDGAVVGAGGRLSVASNARVVRFLIVAIHVSWLAGACGAIFETNANRLLALML